MNAALYEEFVTLPFTTYADVGAGMAARTEQAYDARGVLCTVYVKTVTSGNINVRMSAMDPHEGGSSQVTANITITAPGTYVMVVGPNVALQPPGEAADTTHANISKVVAIPLPAKFRFSFLKSDTSAWEFGISLRRWR